MVLRMIEEEIQALLRVRNLRIIRDLQWWGVGLVLESPGRASLRIFVDYRDEHVDVSFMSPVHLDETRTFVEWPYCEDPFHRFALWQVLRAKGMPNKMMTARVDIRDLTSLRNYIKSAIELVRHECLEILDGDLSISSKIVVNRLPSPWDSDGE